MIKYAMQRLSKLNFYQRNILQDDLPIKDYYICSGALNILTKQEMYHFILNCYNSSTKGFAFNFLKNETLNDVSVAEILDFCKQLCKNIKVENDYLENDISVYLQKHLTN